MSTPRLHLEERREGPPPQVRGARDARDAGLSAALAAPPILNGYAAVFNRETVIAGEFREVILPGAFDRTLSEDIRALVNHDTSKVLGRTVAGTLRLSVDAHGLRYEIDVPATTYGRDLAESVRRGDVSQSSFGFFVLEDEWERPRTATELPLRRLRRVTVFEVSPVTFPAYKGTSVQASPTGLTIPARSNVVTDQARRRAAAEWERFRFLANLT